MSEVIKENGTFFEIAARAAEYAAEKGKVSEKKLAKALGIRMPTASKTVCALALMGVLGKKDGRYYPYTGNGAEAAEVRARAAEYPQDYLPLVEDAAAFGKIGADGYMTGTLLPAVKIGVMYGSVSVIFLQRKMSVVFERAHEIYDIMAVCGMFGGEDEFNPGRKKFIPGSADYDALYARFGAGV